MAYKWRIECLVWLISLLMLLLDAQQIQARKMKDRMQTVEKRLTAQQSTIFTIMSRLNGISSQVSDLRSRLHSNYTIQGRSNDSDCECGNLSSRLEELSQRMDELSKDKSRLVAHDAPPRDCSDLPAAAPSGVYDLTLGLPGISGRPTVPAYCDLRTDGGGWTVIQRRGNVQPLQNFELRWADYQKGFGQLHGEMWWGLENMFQMTGPKDRQYELRINMMDTEGTARHAIYGEFRVDNEAHGYQLTISNYTGDAGDSLHYHTGCKFSTIDKDQDLDEKQKCGRTFRSGWWYRACQSANLNGRHKFHAGNSKLRITWSKWPGKTYTIQNVVMKIRPVKKN